MPLILLGLLLLLRLAEQANTVVGEPVKETSLHLNAACRQQLSDLQAQYLTATTAASRNSNIGVGQSLQLMESPLPCVTAPLTIDSKVLITGAAGFLGFHFAHYLVNEHHIPGKSIIGIDSFTGEYEVQAKRRRAAALQIQFGVDVRDGDACDFQTISSLLVRNNFTHLFHLAYPVPSAVGRDRARTGQLIGDQDPHRPPCHWEELLKLFSLTPVAVIYIADKSNGNFTRRAAAVRFEARAAEGGTVHVSTSYRISISIPLASQNIELLGPHSRPDSVVHRFILAMLTNSKELTAPLGNVSQCSSLNSTLLAGARIEVDKGIALVEDFVHTIMPQVLGALSNATECFVSSCGSSSSLQIFSFNTVLMILADLLHSKFQLVSLSGRELLQCLGIIYDGIRDVAELRAPLERMLEWFIDLERQNMACVSECAYSSKINGNDGSKAVCFSSAWDAPALESRRLTRGCRIVVYTAAIGKNVGALHHVPVSASSAGGHDSSNPFMKCAIAFISSDAPVGRRSSDNTTVAQFGNWALVPVGDLSASFPDTRKASRVPKLSPGHFFDSSVKYALYVDNKLLLRVLPEQLVHMMQQIREPSSNRRIRHDLVPYQFANKTIDGVVEVGTEATPPLDVVMMAVRHPIAVNVYKEAYAVLHNPKRINPRDAAKIATPITFYAKELNQQIDAYHSYQSLHGMTFTNVFDGALLLHNLHSTRGKKFRCKWYREYIAWSDRDVVAGAYAMSAMILDSGIDFRAPINARVAVRMLRKGYRQKVSVGFGRNLEWIPIAQHYAPEEKTENGMGYVHLLPSQEHWYNSHRIARVMRWAWN